jgi:hypothetical protein
MGDHPPKGHKICEWRPPLPAPIHNRGNPPSSSSSTHTCQALPPHQRNLRQRLFSNVDNKSKVTTPSINNFEQAAPPLDISEDHLLDLIMEEIEATHSTPSDSTSPEISAFVTDQHQSIPPHHSHHDPTDDTSPMICSMSNSHHSEKLKINPTSSAFNFSPPFTSSTKVIMYTPPRLHPILLAGNFSSIPNKQFLSKHSKAISKIYPSIFHRVSSLTFQVDGGANCCAVANKSSFYFYLTLCSINCPCLFLLYYFPLYFQNLCLYWCLYLFHLVHSISI